MSNPAKDAENSRAPERACEAADFIVSAVSVPPGSEDRRTPIAIVEGQIGPLRLAVTVSSLQGNKLLIRPPVAGDGRPAVELPEAWQASLTRSAVEAVRSDAIAYSVLRRQGRPRAPSG